MPRLSAYKTLWAFPRCDVVITNTRFFTLSAVGALLAKRWRAPHVHIEHGAVHVPHQKSFVRAVAWVYDQTIGRCVLLCAKQIVTVSRAGISFVKRLGVPERKVRVIANAVAHTTFKRDTRGARILHAKLVIPPKKNVLLFVGRLVREKGVRELITAVQGLPVTIVIVGEGPERAPAETLAQELGVSVRFAGAVPRDALPAYYSLARLFVNPSWAEGLPTTVLESLACGTPVVATDVGGTGEILPAQALVAPKNVRALRERVQAALRKRGSVAKLPAQYTTPALQASWTAVLHKILR
jgi:glycosyltransferase involved in cell wall biosynthesis